MESGIVLRAHLKLPTVGAAQCEVEHYFHVPAGPVQGTGDTGKPSSKAYITLGSPQGHLYRC